MFHFRAVLLITLTSLAVACSSNSPDPANPDGGNASSDGSAAIDASGPGPDAPTGDNVVPESSAELFAYLQAGTYDQFAAEAAPHPSTGPHGAMVRSFFNSSLETSLRAGASSHPIGSAVVKELINSGGTLSGWAVMVKTATAGVAADWYYYEVFSTTNNNPVADGNGDSSCFGCHSSGTDYIRTAFP